MFAVNVPYFWTSGRLCDFDGCDRPDFFPKNINGWFWSANQARLAPTDSKLLSTLRSRHTVHRGRALQQKDYLVT